jgi:hypothetical protein
LLRVIRRVLHLFITTDEIGHIKLSGWETPREIP